MRQTQNRTLGSRPLDEVVDATRALYARADQKRLAWDLWFHTCHHAAGLARVLRTGGTQNGWREELADTTLWLFTLISRASGVRVASGDTEPDLEAVVHVSGRCSDLLWLRYPGVCPTCLHSGRDVPPISDGPLVCSCSPLLADQLGPKVLRGLAPQLQSLIVERAPLRPTSVDAWQKYLSHVFQRSMRGVSEQHLGALVAEQVGFVCDAILRLYSYTLERPPTRDEAVWRRTCFELELANLTCLAFLTAEKGGERLSSLIDGRYPSNSLGDLTCWACKQSLCSCNLRLAPHDIRVAELLTLMAS